MEVATTRLEKKILKEIDSLSREKQMDRTTFLRNLIHKDLEIERKIRIDKKLLQKKLSERL